MDFMSRIDTTWPHSCETKVTLIPLGKNVTAKAVRKHIHFGTLAIWLLWQSCSCSRQPDGGIVARRSTGNTLVGPYQKVYMLAISLNADGTNFVRVEEFVNSL
ncbi:hypothetical protein BC830DRAFT_1152660 [Chytriomyces sp. MP71]|nr:hypothetical protein BC830DRAFT_1152660 [Chytriomyces sp. MP71]